MQIKKQQASRVLGKLRFEVRSGKEKFAQLWYGNQLIVTTSVPKGKGDMYVSNQFRQQLKINEDQLREAIRCPFGYDEYIEHLKDIGKIQT